MMSPPRGAARRIQPLQYHGSSSNTGEAQNEVLKIIYCIRILGYDELKIRVALSQLCDIWTVQPHLRLQVCSHLQFCFIWGGSSCLYFYIKRYLLKVCVRFFGGQITNLGDQLPPRPRAGSNSEGWGMRLPTGLERSRTDVLKCVSQRHMMSAVQAWRSTYYILYRFAKPERWT